MKIGSGYTSIVTEELIQNQICAKKQFNNLVSYSQKKNEVCLLQLLNHENCIKYVDSDINFEWVATQLALKQDLFDFTIQSQSFFSFRIVAYIVKKLLLALDYLHSLGYVHQDVKLDNILINPQNFMPILADFGFAASFYDSPQLQVGTIGYMAPEVISGNNNFNLSKRDVYSLGIVSFCLLFKRFPGETHEMQNWQKFWSENNASGSYKKFFEKMVAFNQNDRFSVQEALKSEFIRQADFVSDEEYQLEMRIRYKEVVS